MEPCQLSSFVDPKDGSQDDIERNSLHLRLERERTTNRPVFDHPVSNLTHYLAVGLHAFAMKGRHHQPSLLPVPRPVEHEQGMLSDKGPEDLPRLSGRKLVRVASEDFLNCFGVTEQYNWRIAWETNGEILTVA